eukprot:COSAG02_NODE_33625_length_497_cov_0.927136_1_plen_78_part_00
MAGRFLDRDLHTRSCGNYPITDSYIIWLVDLYAATSCGGAVNCWSIARTASVVVRFAAVVGVWGALDGSPHTTHNTT